jgi:tetratricopeptide (TPR) repeat protein
MIGDYPGSAHALEEALGLYRDLGDRLGLANAWSYLGYVLRLTGDYPAAALALDEALAIYDDIGDRGGAVEMLNERGTLYRVSGELALAQGCHQQSLDMSREMGSSWDEAHALEIFQRIGAAEAPDLLAELNAQ